MRLFIALLLLSLLSHSLYAFTPQEHADLLSRVKATKSLQRKELKKHISRFKQSRNIRSKAFKNRKISVKYKQQIRRLIRQQKAVLKRAP